MPRLLIGIISCHAFRNRANAQRATWAKPVEGADLRFFVGRHPDQQVYFGAMPDEVRLDCDDGYKALPHKSQLVHRWALEHGYEFIRKLDDDVYARPERLLASHFEHHDYMGRLRGSSGSYPAPYCSGFSYGLSRRAMKIIAEAHLNGDDAEDRFIGNTLLKHGIHPFPDYRNVVVSSNRNAISYHEGPRQGNDIMVACEFEPQQMFRMHDEFLKAPAENKYGPLPSGPLDRVCVMIKTFLRDGYLVHSLSGLETNFPECKLVIVDDGTETRQKMTLAANFQNKGHVWLRLPFDSGFGAKANAAVPFCDREYVLIGSDDFIFNQEARAGVEKLQKVLDACPEIGVASGRVNGREYEAILDERDGEVFERAGLGPADSVQGIQYALCDLTVNYSLIRREVLKSVHWDSDVKIGGGEHGAFFLDVKRAGWKVCVVPEVNIREMLYDQSKMDVRYPQMRNRARHSGRPCLKRRGINRWHGMGGQVEEC